MSDMAMAIPLARLFGALAVPAGPTEAERRQALEAAAFAAGQAAAEAHLGPRLARLEEELAALRAAQRDAIDALEQQSAAALAALESAFAGAVAELGLTAASAVLAAEPHVGAETLAGLVAEALQGLPGEAAGTLWMNPVDAAAAPVLPAGWTLSTNAALPRGEVIAERGSTLSAAGLSRRMDQLLARLEMGE
jgi:flagellar biosynthesis/type III secretory pathway protein FliH